LLFQFEHRKATHAKNAEVKKTPYIFRNEPPQGFSQRKQTSCVENAFPDGRSTLGNAFHPLHANASDFLRTRQTLPPVFPGYHRDLISFLDNRTRQFSDQLTSHCIKAVIVLVNKIYLSPMDFQVLLDLFLSKTIAGRLFLFNFHGL